MLSKTPSEVPPSYPIIDLDLFFEHLGVYNLSTTPSPTCVFISVSASSPIVRVLPHLDVIPPVANNCFERGFPFTLSSKNTSSESAVAVLLASSSTHSTKAASLQSRQSLASDGTLSPSFRFFSHPQFNRRHHLWCSISPAFLVVLGCTLEGALCDL